MDSNIASQEKGASSSAARNLSLNTSAVHAEEPANELPASVSDFESNSGSTTQDGEMQTEFTDHEVYLTEIINNNDKRIQEMEQEIKELMHQSIPAVTIPPRANPRGFVFFFSWNYKFPAPELPETTNFPCAFCEEIPFLVWRTALY